MNRVISLEKIPERIVSLVPSQTELLVDLGLGDRVVGVTKFCVHPKGFKQRKTIVGGTKNFNFEKIDLLQPDLVIGNKEENYKEGIEQLSERHPVWMSDIYDSEDAFQMMEVVGEITGRQEISQKIIQAISTEFQAHFASRGTAIYLIWQNPMITVGVSTFIDHMLQKSGFENPVKKERYPEISREEILELNPDYIFLSSEPYPFREKHLEEYRKYFPQSKIKVVDGEMFSWYGSRMLQAPGYFRSLWNSF
jgi:ABC-type Fe3+-hydroxamate transport system substrate-binding protein